MMLPLDIPAAALLLVDVQRDLADPGGAWVRSGRDTPGPGQPPIGAWQRLCEVMRAAGRPVIFALTQLRADRADWALPDSYRDLPMDFLVEGRPGAALVDGLVRHPSDFAVVKKGLSAFQHTHLDRLLGNLGIRHCVVAGGTATGGLADTVRSGAPLGYELFIVQDAVFPSGSPFLRRLEVRADFTTVDEIARLAAQTPPAHAASSAVTALIVVDMQNDFLHRDGAMRRCGYSPLTDETAAEAIENNRLLANAVRSRGWPVVWAKVGQRPDGLDRATDDVVTKRLRPLLTQTEFMHRGVWGSELVDELNAQPQDIVLEKQGHSAFGFTSLHRTLRNLGVTHCLVTGGATTGCVSDTVREGIGLGYGVTVISDATYPPGSPYLDALSTIAEVVSTQEALTTLLDR